MSRLLVPHLSVDAAPPSTLPSLPWEQSLDVGGGLILVLLAIIACAWFGKRILRITPNTDGQLEIVSGVSLGARDRVVLLAVGNQKVLLGVSPGRIQTLYVLPANEADTSIELSGSNSTQRPFSGELDRVLSKPTGEQS